MSQLLGSKTYVTSDGSVPVTGSQTFSGGQVLGTAPMPTPSGSAPVYGCRAWVNFDGTGTIGTNMAIRASGNVASVYKNGTGRYKVNFTIPMEDANYCVTIMGGQKTVSWGLPIFETSTPLLAGSVSFLTQSTGDVANDCAYVTVAIFR